MESKIKKIKRDLRGIKKNSHALARLIEIQGIHFKRIEAISALEKSERNKQIIEKEKEIISHLGIEDLMEKSQVLEERYMKIINKLPERDRAIILDVIIGGLTYYKMGAKYGYTEEGMRKKVNSVISTLSKYV